jgi:hypothetical protein
MKGRIPDVTALCQCLETFHVWEAGIEPSQAWESNLSCDVEIPGCQRKVQVDRSARFLTLDKDEDEKVGQIRCPRRAFNDSESIQTINYLLQGKL